VPFSITHRDLDTQNNGEYFSVRGYAHSGKQRCYSPRDPDVQFRRQSDQDVADGIGGLQPRLGPIRHAKAEVMDENFDWFVRGFSDLK
jgi:hypothetical protein